MAHVLQYRSRMHNVAALSLELSTLRAALAVHQALIDAAYIERENAFEFCLPLIGFRYDVSRLELYPAAFEAERRFQVLSNDDGYYWTQSRIMDIERVIGLGFTNQVNLFADIPAAHECVAPWVREQLFALAA